MKSFSQFRILCCHTYRTGIQVTFTHHDTTFNYQCGSCNTPLFCTQQGSHSDITYLSSSVHLPAQQYGFGVYFLPGSGALLPRPNSHGKPACLIELIGDAPVPPSKPEISTTSAFALATPAAMVPTPAFDTNFTLIRAARLAFFKSEYQLGQIFNRINIVVRGRGNQTHAWGRVPCFTNPVIYFMAG